MSKFVVVKQAPADLRDGEHVIEMPTFLEEIQANANKAPRNNLVGVNHLRAIVGSIGDKYDPALTSWNIRPHEFEGRAFANDRELSRIVIELLEKQYPSIFDSYLSHKVKQRPVGTKLVYFVGPFQKSMAFFMNGLDSIEEKEIDVYLGLKPKKVIGKPAITKQQAEGSVDDDSN